MQKSSSGANEQGSREKLAWLAGIIDGEGSISVNRMFKDTPEGKVPRAYHPRVYVNNTDFRMIEAIALILEAHGIRYYANPTTKVKPTYLASRKECRWIIMISVTGMRSCIQLLELITPYLVAKKRQAELLYEYCQKRLAQMCTNNWELTPEGYVQRGAPPNTLGEFYVAAIKAERAREFDPSETTRRPSYFRLHPTVE